jgi:hypothetical protein
MVAESQPLTEEIEGGKEKRQDSGRQRTVTKENWRWKVTIDFISYPFCTRTFPICFSIREGISPVNRLYILNKLVLPCCSARAHLLEAQTDMVIYSASTIGNDWVSVSKISDSAFSNSSLSIVSPPFPFYGPRCRAHRDLHTCFMPGVFARSS